ncbi:hypothetical protein [Actinobacillus porcinus]|uniref:hypothetical protein n=1 Tax=Actinobacillus porcinus TaxID=51048 RepID=UPI0023F302B3|nr:hypothetical protein [Actinobacillus porcinus]MDD7545613.1 hypothetical protein [Actinobacillus porcinus]MDY5847594.1 hypothetical protein [Actinobacillus porcinus]
MIDYYYDNVFLGAPDDIDEEENDFDEPDDDPNWEARDQDCEYWQRVMRDDYVP